MRCGMEVCTYLILQIEVMERSNTAGTIFNEKSFSGNEKLLFVKHRSEFIPNISTARNKYRQYISSYFFYFGLEYYTNPISAFLITFLSFKDKLSC
jgi:hypothetical protein